MQEQSGWQPKHLLFLIGLVRTLGVCAGFRCPSPYGMFSHDTDCSKYYVCAMWTVFVMPCHPGLRYNPYIHTCDYPKNVVCFSKTFTTTTSVPLSDRKTGQLETPDTEESFEHAYPGLHTGTSSVRTEESGFEEESENSDEINGLEFRPAVTMPPRVVGTPPPRRVSKKPRLIGAKDISGDEPGSGMGFG